jgi:nucleoside-diphosphate-sugar epimerase
MAGTKKLVMGASGFLGSHVTRQLVERGDDVRVILPPMDHGKAERELGWQPTPIHDSVRRAAQFFRENRLSSS